jgi:hypothetical protein
MEDGEDGDEDGGRRKEEGGRRQKIEFLSNKNKTHEKCYSRKKV